MHSCRQVAEFFGGRITETAQILPSWICSAVVWTMPPSSSVTESRQSVDILDTIPDCRCLTFRVRIATVKNDGDVYLFTIVRRVWLSKPGQGILIVPHHLVLFTLAARGE